jgi:tripartite-type tricarboxylate transporter receptor subunit TctC
MNGPCARALASARAAVAAVEPRAQAVTLAACAPDVLVVHRSMPAKTAKTAKTAKDFIDHARANPGKLAYASHGNGS